MNFKIKILALSFWTIFAYAREAITLFHSDITINKDATLLVRETIQVISEGNAIRRGIIREFPTHYRHLGSNYVVSFQILKVLQDGVPAEYELEHASNGQKVLIGGENLLTPGKHTYIIEYATNRQLGFFSHQDELYWNVTGNGWRLPIDKAEVVVHLPAGIENKDITAEAYTGYYGEQETNYTHSIHFAAQNTQGNRALGPYIYFATTKPLRPLEGITIAVTWPKGVVTEPSWTTKLYWFFADNALLILIFLVLCLLGIFYLHCWHLMSVADRPGTIIPRFYPPAGMMPSAVAALLQKKFLDPMLAPDIVNLAVSGYITISTTTRLWGLSSDYTLTTTKDLKEWIAADPHWQSSYDGMLMSALFSKGNVIKMTQSNRAIIKNAIDVAQENSRLSRYLINLPVPPAMQIGFFAALLALGFGIVSLWLPHYEQDFMGIETTALYVLVLILVGCGVSLFSHWFKIYSPDGKKLRDEIEGFKMYLSTVEAERMKVIGSPPTKTPELYEKYLPYAMALGVDAQWTLQFDRVFAELARQGHAYVPGWYMGRGRFYSHDFSSSLHSSLTTAISSSTRAPGSSSGSGGRGFSGGGGGGGGGGGR